MNVVLQMVELHDLVCCAMYKYVLDLYVLLLSLLLLLIPCMLISKIHHFLSSMSPCGMVCVKATLNNLP